METKQWTKEELETHMKQNCDYGSIIVCGAMFKKLYGEYPKVGLSGFQAEAIDLLMRVIPDPAKLPSLKKDETR